MCPAGPAATFFGGLELSPAVWYLGCMPIYEFHCEKCEQDSEIIVRSSDWEGTPCPHCGSTKLSKKLSVFASSGGGEDAGPSCSKPGGCGCRGGKHNH